MNFIVYDLEATCWQIKSASRVQETIEIGAVKFNGYGEYLGKFSRFIKPKLNPQLSTYCTDLTSITQIQINRAERFPDVIEDFQDWIGIFEEDYQLCSWGSFDKTMLIKDCVLHDYETDWLEAHINIKRQYHDRHRSRQTIGLHRAVEREGFEFTGIHHRAISDAENLGKIFLKYLDEWVY